MILYQMRIFQYNRPAGKAFPGSPRASKGKSPPTRSTSRFTKARFPTRASVPANFPHTGSAGWPRRTIRWQNKNKSRFPRHCVTRCCYEKKAVPSAARSTAPCCCTVLKPRQDGPASTHRRSSAARSAAPAFASFPKSSPQTNWPPDGWCGWTLPPNRWSTKISLFIILTNTCRRRPQN